MTSTKLKKEGKAMTPPHQLFARPRRIHRGSAMIEFILVGPVLTLMGMGILQYSLMFNAKNMVNQASFMAVRAGSMGNARLSTIDAAYTRALIPLYGGGRDSTELAQSYAKAVADTAGNARVELLNPTKESFDKYNDTALEAKYGARAIPNGGQAFKDPNLIDSASGQNIQDANLLKLKITHGYELKVPIVGPAMQYMMKWGDNDKDPFVTSLYDKRRIPVVTHVTLQMQSDPIEPTNPISVSGTGNNGNPTDPRFPEDPPKEPPNCRTISCQTPKAPPSTPTDPSAPPEFCKAPATSDFTAELSADTYFEFGKATLSAQGSRNLDQLIAQSQQGSYDAIDIVGHTDQLGSAAVNNKLSLDRATAVKDYLVRQGVSTKPFKVVGKGSQDPKVSLSSCPASGQAQISCLASNRRVEVTLKNFQR